MNFDCNLDLFGDEVVRPTGSIDKHVFNAAEGFVEWWAEFPSRRKARKQQCLNKWARHGFANSAKQILSHTVFMKESSDWVKDGGQFIPGPEPYLNARAWEEWTPPKPKPLVDPALEKIARDKVISKPPSPEILAKLKELRK